MSVRPVIAIALSVLGFAQACPFHSAHDAANVDYAAIAADNNNFRTKRNIAALPSRTTIYNVRVFDGSDIQPPTSVTIDNGIIISIDETHETQYNSSTLVDGKGGVLLPGLIDAHAHPQNISDLQVLSSYGITTTISMACFFPELCKSITNHTGLVDIIPGSLPAAAPNSTHGNIVVAVDGNQDRLIHNSSQALTWLDDALSWGPAFVKLIAEFPGLDQKTLNILTKASHDKGKRVAAHAAAHDAYVQAATAGVDNIQHCPADFPIPQSLAKGMACRHQVATPTLAVLKGISETSPRANYTASEESVRRLRAAGVPILAGTDAHPATMPGLPPVFFGSSLHEELQLLVNAGLTPREALRAATSVAADHWGLSDRGVIAPGKRADLVLVDGNPLEDITATRSIQRMWFAGVEFDGAVGTF